MSNIVVTEQELDATLLRVSQLAVRHVDGADMAGITLVRDGKPVTTGFTDPTAPEVDAAQYRTGCGPCLSAFRDAVVYRIRETREDTRWPEFSAAAAEKGLLSTLSLPLVIGAHAVGALNLYSSRADAFNADEDALVFATQAAIVLANAEAYWTARRLAEQLETALQSRAVIEQAKGVLMGKHGCTADEAFEQLRADSQHANRKLRDVAADVVRRSEGR